MRLRSDETNVVGKEKEDGGENGRAKVVNVVVDVLEQVRIGSERENAEGRGVVSYRSSLSQRAHWASRDEPCRGMETLSTMTWVEHVDHASR